MAIDKDDPEFRAALEAEIARRWKNVVSALTAMGVKYSFILRVEKFMLRGEDQ